MSSTATSAEHGSTKQVNSRGRVIVASLIGTTVEFYDFYVYATAEGNQRVIDVSADGCRTLAAFDL